MRGAISSHVNRSIRHTGEVRHIGRKIKDINTLLHFHFNYSTIYACINFLYMFFIGFLLFLFHRTKRKVKKYISKKKFVDIQYVARSLTRKSESLSPD
jgi:hypothetical protein